MIISTVYWYVFVVIWNRMYTGRLILMDKIVSKRHCSVYAMQ